MTGIGITALCPIVFLLNCGRILIRRVVLVREENSGKNLLANAVMDSKILGKHKKSSKCLVMIFLGGREVKSTGSLVL